jgi:hypothetical protein
VEAEWEANWFDEHIANDIPGTGLETLRAANYLEIQSLIRVLTNGMMNYVDKKMTTVDDVYAMFKTAPEQRYEGAAESNEAVRTLVNTLVPHLAGP